MPVYVPPYLPPTGSPPLEGSDLEDAIHDVIAGITGLDNTLVQPRWQPEPVDIPAAATAWVAFGFKSRVTSQYPEVDHDGDGDGSDVLKQHETLEVLCSFYDLGAGGQADKNLALLRDGLFIAQNREAMAQESLFLIGVSDAMPAPVLLKERWQYRVDLTVTLRREIDRTYAVPNITSAEGAILSQSGAETPKQTPFLVTEP